MFLGKSVPVRERFFLCQQEEKMGLRKELKKGFKEVGKAIGEPLNAVNMMYSAYALDKHVENHQKRVEGETKAREAAMRQAAADAVEQDFENELDRKRRASKRTNVIFAGLLGDNDEIGLGGQKNLLGL